MNCRSDRRHAAVTPAEGAGAQRASHTYKAPAREAAHASAHAHGPRRGRALDTAAYHEKTPSSDQPEVHMTLARPDNRSATGPDNRACFDTGNQTLVTSWPTLVGEAPTVYVALADGAALVSRGPYPTIDVAQAEADAWMLDLAAPTDA
jgi:hypothetical protein